MNQLSSEQLCAMKENYLLRGYEVYCYRIQSVFGMKIESFFAKYICYCFFFSYLCGIT